MDDLSAAIAEMVPELQETRQHLHMNPELSDHEQETSALVADRLRGLGLEVRVAVGGHGVVSCVRGARPGRTLALRADMDALPIQEESGLAYSSRKPGVMHACGHDGHTTVLLGAARALAGARERFEGEVRLIFQPAEETVGGARRMCEDGAMQGVDAILALHGWPHVELGQVGVRSGPMMASSDTFDIEILGVGAHAAYPHLAVDPIVVGAQIVLALQSIRSREIDPSTPVVVTVSKFHAGTAYNIIPGSASIGGTVRTHSAELRATMPERIRRIAESICESARASCRFTYTEGTGPVVNDEAMMDLVRRVAAEALGPANVIEVPVASMGAEDFSAYLDHAPGAMFRLGLGAVSPLHTPTFNFDDRAVPVGVEILTRAALAYLAEPA